MTAAKIKEDTAALTVRETQLKQEEERLGREKRELERQRSSFDEERDRIGRLGLEVRKRSEEIEELCEVGFWVVFSICCLVLSFCFWCVCVCVCVCASSFVCLFFVCLFVHYSATP